MLEQGQASTPVECSESWISKKGTTTKIIYQRNFPFIFPNKKEKIRQIQQFNSEGKKIKEIFYHKDGKRIKWAEEFNRQGNKVKTISYFYRKNETLEQTQECDEQRGGMKLTFYREDGKTLNQTQEFDAQVNKVNTIFYFYREDGILEQTQEYDDKKRLRKLTFYREDGTIEQVQEIDENAQLRRKILYQGGNKVKTIFYFYREDGTIKQTQEFDEQRGGMKVMFYLEDGTIEQVQEFDENTKLKRVISYQKDGAIKTIKEYDWKENKVKTTFYFYREDGTIKYIQKFEGEGKLKTEIFYRKNKTIDKMLEYDESGNIKRITIFSKHYDHGKAGNDKGNIGKWFSVVLNPNSSVGFDTGDIEVAKLDASGDEKIKIVDSVLSNSFYGALEDNVGLYCTIVDLFIGVISTPEQKNRLFCFYENYGECLTSSAYLRKRIFDLPENNGKKFVITPIENKARNHSVLAIVPADPRRQIMIFDSSNAAGDFLCAAGREKLGLHPELATDTIVINHAIQNNGTCAYWAAFAALYFSGLSDEELEKLYNTMRGADDEAKEVAARKLEVKVGALFLIFMYNIYKQKEARLAKASKRLKAVLKSKTTDESATAASSTTPSTLSQDECFTEATKPKHATRMEAERLDTKSEYAVPTEKELTDISKLFAQEKYKPGYQKAIVEYTQTVLPKIYAARHAQPPAQEQHRSREIVAGDISL